MLSFGHALGLLTSRIRRDTRNGSLARKGVFAPILVLALALAFTYSTAQAQSFSAPTLSATTYSKAQINLTWTDPNPNSPLNPNESGYIVERAKGTPTSFTKVFTSAANVTSWASTGLSTATVYYYRVRAYGVVNGQTVYSDYSPIASATTQSSLYPNPARSLTATALSPTQITLKWSDRSSNEAGYEVERAASSTGPWAQIGTTSPSAISYTDSALTPSTAYYYRVIAYNSTGDSPPSNVATAITKPDLTPPTVSISSPAPGSTYSVAQTVEIRATASDAIGVSRVDFFDGGVFKGSATSSPYSYFWPITGTDNGSHTWTAKAYDSSNSALSSAVTLTVNISPADVAVPTSALSINAGAAYTTVTAVALNLSATDAVGVTGYYVSASATPPTLADLGWVGVPSTPIFGVTIPYTVSSGDGTKTLYAWYRDAIGNVSPAASASILLDQTAPGSGSATAIAGNSQVTVSWSGFTDSGSGLTSAPYKLFSSTTAFPASCNGTPQFSGSQTSYTDSGLINGTTYYYRVCATDKAGNTSSGATASAAPQASDTAAPGGTLAFTPSATYTSSTAMTLALAATDNVGVTGYYVSASSTPPTASAAGWATVASTTNYNGNLPYALTSGDGSKTVYVWYKDANGNLSPAASASIVLDQTAPSNGSATATAGSGQVTVSWSGFTDAGSGLASTPYKLFSSTTDFPASCSGTPQFSGSQTSYTHTGLTNGTTYYYRVCAFDNAGNPSTGVTASAAPQASDTTAPAGSLAFTPSGNYTSSTALTLALAATDTVGVTGYYVSGSSTTPAATASLVQGRRWQRVPRRLGFHPLGPDRAEQWQRNGHRGQRPGHRELVRLRRRRQRPGHHEPLQALLEHHGLPGFLQRHAAVLG